LQLHGKLRQSVKIAIRDKLINKYVCNVQKNDHVFTGGRKNKYRK